MQVATWVTTAAAALGVVGIVAAAAAVARSSHIRETLALLRGEVADLSAAGARKDGKLLGLEAERDELKAEVAMLRELATGRADIEGLAGEVRALADAIRSQSAAVTLALREEGGERGWSRPPTGGSRPGSPPATG